jgi:hypothetical protein
VNLQIEILLCHDLVMALEKEQKPKSQLRIEFDQFLIRVSFIAMAASVVYPPRLADWFFEAAWKRAGRDARPSPEMRQLRDWAVGEVHKRRNREARRRQLSGRTPT